jgi:hypothetical protein
MMNRILTAPTGLILVLFFSGLLAASGKPGILVYCYGPVDFYITDAAGNVTGKNPGTGLPVTNIPGSSLAEKKVPGRAPGMTVTLAEHGIGPYRLNLKGIGNGVFVIDVETTDSRGRTANLHEVNRISAAQLVSFTLAADGLVITKD